MATIRHRIRFFKVGITPAFLVGVFVLISRTAYSADEVDFARDVRPILSRYCFKCHGPDDEQRKSNLRLDVREHALAAAESGNKAIVPGKPEQSELVSRISSSDSDTLMPPPSTKTSLSADQKETLRRWISAGAEYRPHWAFVPPKQAPLPGVKQASWPRNEIDYFVLAKLEKMQLSPSPEADAHTLLRRVSLDLIGLPPESEEVDSVMNAARKSPDAPFDANLFSAAYEKYVARLLQSPRYGERWARRWLDLARYSDTNGYEKDRQRIIWPYRDWVIHSLNADLPFDQFTIEQIAGDMLPNATQSQQIATGFHRNTMLNEEGGIDPLEYRFYALTDRVATTGATWLGLTLGCAQCHNHKYDPISQTDYYRLFACLNNADEPTLEIPTAEQLAARQKLQTEIDNLEMKLAETTPEPRDFNWTSIRSGTATSAQGAKLTMADDGLVQVSGSAPEKDTYSLEFESDLPDIGAVRLEAIAGDPLPAGGPGRAPNGNFVLSEINVQVSEVDAPAAPLELAITSASADAEQEGYPAAQASDGNPATGWAIHIPGQKWNVNRTIDFTLAKNPALASQKKRRWKVVLTQQFGEQHTLGRFRISLGNVRSSPEKALASANASAANKAFVAWAERTRAKINTWRALVPHELKSNMPLLIHEGGGIVFAAGDQTKSDTYDLVFRDLPAGITALRVEALPDSRLPNHGPGRIYYEGPIGDFTLCNFTVSANGEAHTISQGKASFAAGNFGAEKALDADMQTGWSIQGGVGKRHVAVFTFANPLPGDIKELLVKMLFERHFAAGLGKFRIWATTDAIVNPPVELPSEVEQALATDASQRSSEQKSDLLKYYVQIAPEYAAARKRIEHLRSQLPKPTTTLVMQEWPAGRTRSTSRYHRGEFLQPKEEVTPGVPGFLPGLPVGEKANRLSLARWIVSKNNPLTARVAVNRQWEAFFGRGFVRTSADIGLQGDLPSHPELLDHLAVDFMNRGWSMKELHRLIVTSATYRQSSRITPDLAKIDAENRLLARGPRVRLEAELIRDGALAASGLIAHKLGGPSVFPPQPASISSEGAYGALAWNTSVGPDRYRRSLYTFSKRTAPFALYNTFDAPIGDACIARRDVSNTPLQALSLMNDEVFREAARALGQRLTKLPNPEARIVAAYRLALARPPTPEELKTLQAFYQTQFERLDKGELHAQEIGGVAGKPGVEVAACTLLARVMFNLDEFVTKQ